MNLLYMFLLFTLFFSSCKQESSVVQSAASTPNIQQGSCNIGKWNDSALPLNLKISPELVSDFAQGDIINNLNPIDQIAKVWNNALAPTKTLFQLPLQVSSSNGSSSLSDFRDNELGIYKSHLWFKNVSSNALAVTQFFGTLKSDGSLGTYIELTHADILLNYRDFGSSFSYNVRSFLDYDVPTIVLHEMGHFLGLCHENTSPSIMANYYLSTQRTLKDFDTKKIQALYLNNTNNGVNAIIKNTNALSLPIGSPVKGIVELNSNGICKHFINGKLIYEHIQQ